MENGMTMVGYQIIKFLFIELTDNGKTRVYTGQ